MSAIDRLFELASRSHPEQTQREYEEMSILCDEAAAELATLRAVVEAARGALVAYPRAGTKLSDAMLVLYDALAAYDKVTK